MYFVNKTLVAVKLLIVVYDYDSYHLHILSHVFLILSHIEIHNLFFLTFTFRFYLPLLSNSQRTWSVCLAPFSIFLEFSHAGGIHTRNLDPFRTIFLCGVQDFHLFIFHFFGNFHIFVILIICDTFFSAILTYSHTFRICLF